MAATNYSVFRGKDVESFKFGDTAWSEADMASTAAALHTTFATNNASPLLDVVGDRDANDPVKSEAFAKEIRITGGEVTVNEDDLLGCDTSGAQNKEIGVGAASRLTCEVTLVYRNNVPLSIYNATTECALIEMNNNETTTTGALNIAMNNVEMTKVGDLTINADGNTQQMITFTFKGGRSGTPIAVTDSGTWTTASKVRSADYAEEVRLS